MQSFAERYSLFRYLADYLDPHQPKPIERRGWMLFALLILLAGIPSLWAPFDGDQALFFVSGQKILRGDVLYRDVVDLKPPLIYFIYAGAIGLFGKSLLAVRLVELLVQGSVIWIIVQMVRRASANDAFAFLSGLFYAALYFSLPYYCRAQVEGFAALPIALIFSLLIRRYKREQKQRADLLLPIIGLSIGVLILLKTSFLVMLPLVAFILLFDGDCGWMKWFGRTTITALGMIPPLAIAFLYLWINNAMGDFSLMQKFTGGYAAAQWTSFSVPIMLAVREVPKYFGATWSALLAMLTVAGVFFALFPSSRNQSTEGIEEGERFGNGRGFLPAISTATFLLLLATVAVEAKYLAWHFNRLFVPGAILAAWGCVAVMRRVLTAPMNRFALSVVAVSIIPLLLFSPLVRYTWNNSAFIANALKGNEGFSRFVGMEGEGFDMEELVGVGKYIREHRQPTGKLFVASGWGGSIHYYADDVPDFKLYHSCYLIAPYTPQEWRQQTVDYLLKRQPQFIVAQRDSMPHITGVGTTSLQMLHALPGIDSLLQTDYRVALDTKMTVVYQRIEGRKDLRLE